ncbi:hypothetical protein, partial [Pseudomonas syringae]|uniref:hypothetical protein n=1 Tax=Pseudomonas syringae TaxID=317 RepID=UPI001E50618B
QPGPLSGLTFLYVPPGLSSFTTRQTVYSRLFCNITVFVWSTQTLLCRIAMCLDIGPVHQTQARLR